MRYDRIDATDLAEFLAAPHCVYFARVSSTLDVVHEAAAQGAPAGTVVLADEQIAGRGRQGRSWSSPAGAGIWLGYLVRPARPLEGGLLAIRVGLAAAAVLEELGAAPTLKWPNDVLLHGRKLAGILCEARWAGDDLSWIAVGVGMNVHGPMAGALSRTAIALDEVLPHVTRRQVLHPLVRRLHRLETAPQLSAAEREAYARYDALTGRRLTRPVAGTVEGLSSDGALLVRTGTGVERVVGGGVVPA